MNRDCVELKLNGRIITTPTSNQCSSFSQINSLRSTPAPITGATQKCCRKGRGEGHMGNPCPAQTSQPSVLSREQPRQQKCPNGPIPPHRQRKEMQREIDKGAKLGCLRFKRGEDTLQCPAWQEGVLDFLGQFVCEEATQRVCVACPQFEDTDMRLKWAIAQRSFWNHQDMAGYPMYHIWRKLVSPWRELQGYL